MKLDTKEFEAKMGKSIEAYRGQLMTMRAGRATPDVLSKITVDYYGCPTAVNQMAEVKITDARLAARTFRDVIFADMQRVRKAVDEAEKITAKEFWPVPNYGDLIFRV